MRITLMFAVALAMMPVGAIANTYSCSNAVYNWNNLYGYSEGAKKEATTRSQFEDLIKNETDLAEKKKLVCQFKRWHKNHLGMKLAMLRIALKECGTNVTLEGSCDLQCHERQVAKIEDEHAEACK